MRLGFDKLLERRLVSEGGDRDPEGCVCVCGEGEGVIGRLPKATPSPPELF